MGCSQRARSEPKAEGPTWASPRWACLGGMRGYGLVSRRAAKKPLLSRKNIRDRYSDILQKREYFAMVKLIYTVGYGVSIGSLCIAVFIFCIFRKLLCTRTYIHLNLFSTFILRALAVLCKAVVTFFQYCVLSNFYWLLIEGLYLQTLLVFTFAHRRTFFWWYTLIGWGTPSVAVTIWMFLKHKYDNHGRLAKSTLLLIPLFGVHYIVFALFPEHVGLEARLFFELVLGSFQVQNEIRKEIEKYKSRTDNNTFQMATQDFTA
ncbi:Vasoactive intestinal polypeptide receptor [Anabarilius grahami]|uniref:Vasoactive intestinal polypeptide receptor n=1 Tax=Anabarilius grahami TaxID=495550 RepID=A0A3N0Z6I5_ANAGA|nr:Vasoactive intestinal polypeptide receptor [Anabarilius grahami]